MSDLSRLNPLYFKHVGPKIISNFLASHRMEKSVLCQIYRYKRKILSNKSKNICKMLNKLLLKTLSALIMVRLLLDFRITSYPLSLTAPLQTDRQHIEKIKNRQFSHKKLKIVGRTHANTI